MSSIKQHHQRRWSVMAAAQCSRRTALAALCCRRQPTPCSGSSSSTWNSSNRRVKGKRKNSENWMSMSSSRCCQCSPSPHRSYRAARPSSCKWHRFQQCVAAQEASARLPKVVLRVLLQRQRRSGGHMCHPPPPHLAQAILPPVVYSSRVLLLPTQQTAVTCYADLLCLWGDSLPVLIGHYVCLRPPVK